MLIDWFTVGAQALNFLILVWLLKRFLYKPILKAIDAREKSIAAEQADTDAKRAAAKKEHDDFQGKNKAFDERRDALLAKATDEAKTERERLLVEARKAGDDLRAKQASVLQNDQTRLSKEITQQASEEVFSIVRKTLADLATVSLEERMSEVFIRRLREMDANAKITLEMALKTASKPVLVKSTFDLPAEQKAKIQKALNESFTSEIHVQFETASEKICGIELMANGQKLTWNIADYLGALERKVGTTLDAQATSAATAIVKSGPTTAAKAEAI